MVRACRKRSGEGWREEWGESKERGTVDKWSIRVRGEVSTARAGRAHLVKLVAMDRRLVELGANFWTIGCREQPWLRQCLVKLYGAWLR